MDREQARQDIRARWREFGQPDKKGKGIICPLCGNGTGTDGDGIVENPHKSGHLRCFKCGFSGDAIDLYAQTWNIDSFNEALYLAADYLGITIDPYTPARAAMGLTKITPVDKGTMQADKSGMPQDTSAERLEDYTAYYKTCRSRLADPAALSYLQERGISRPTAEAYYLGYDPEWTSPTAIKRKRENGSAWTPPRTERIIVPVTTNHYFARAIRPAKDEKGKRYAKMNETGGGSVGIFNVRALYGSESVFVVEGIFDALSIIEAGSTAIALNSTSNVEKLLQRLEKNPTRATLIVCLDNDDAGKKATDTLRAGLDRLNIGHIAADISGKFKDPNDALIGDKDAFIKAVQDAQSRTAARPDSTSTYIDTLMQADIDRFKSYPNRLTGFSLLDKESGGLHPGLYILGAISSLGKTTFAGQIADNLAAAGNDVLFFSLEMSRLEMVTKSLARIHAQENPNGTAISSLSFRKGCYPHELMAAASSYKKKTVGHMSVIEGNFSCNVSFVGNYVRHYIQRNSCLPVVFIDYLQILQPAEGFRGTTKESVDNVTTDLKRLSRELDIPIFVISSLNRGNYMLPIDFESFKESGAIEYSADYVWGLQLQCLNDELFTKDKNIKAKREMIRRAKIENPRKVELVCLKNRSGKSSFCVGFDYYPAQDYFKELPEVLASVKGESSHEHPLNLSNVELEPAKKGRSRK